MAVSSLCSQGLGKSPVNLSSVFVKDYFCVSTGSEIFDECFESIVKIECTIVFNSADHVALFLMQSWLMCELTFSRSTDVKVQI